MDDGTGTSGEVFVLSCERDTPTSAPKQPSTTDEAAHADTSQPCSEIPSDRTIQSEISPVPPPWPYESWHEESFRDEQAFLEKYGTSYLTRTFDTRADFHVVSNTYDPAIDKQVVVLKNDLGESHIVAADASTLEKMGVFGKKLGHFVKDLLDSPAGEVVKQVSVKNPYAMAAMATYRAYEAYNEGENKETCQRVGAAALAIGNTIASKPLTSLLMGGLQMLGAVHDYQVGTYDELKKASVPGDGKDVHHVPQSQPAQQQIPDYDRKNAPSVVLPKGEHKRIPTSKGDTELSPRQQLAKDIGDLRKHTQAPRQQLQKLIELAKKFYPIIKK